MDDVFFPLPVPSDPPDTGVFFYPEFGAQWLPVMQGLLQELKDPAIWASPPDDIIGQVDTLLYLLGEAKVLPYPQQYVLFPQAANVISGGAITPVVITTQEFCMVGTQTSPAINDRFAWWVWLKSGLYNVRVNGRTYNSAGRIDWYLNDDLVEDNQDWYSASTINNVTKTFQMNVPEAGLYLFEGHMQSKHASSSGYGWQISSVSLKVPD